MNWLKIYIPAAGLWFAGIMHGNTNFTFPILLIAYPIFLFLISWIVLMVSIEEVRENK